MMKILAIDTSCDETSIAVTEGRRILSNVISSQVRYHRKFGGVVPFLAQRLHRERIDSVVELALTRAGLTWKDIDAIAVTYGPGLAPALEVGIEKAKQWSVEHTKPLYAVNHMMGHLSGAFAMSGLRTGAMIESPLLAVLVSGGHTEMVRMESFGSFQIVGQTLDDALGEAYDKVAVLLGIGYPGGKLVARFSEKGDGNAYPLPIPMRQSKDFNLSYSGLKNAVRLLVKEVSEDGSRALTEKEIQDIAASFERVAQESLLLKINAALTEYPDTRMLVLGGGVAANVRLRAKMRQIARDRGLVFVVPPNLKLCTDNAAMIGIAASFGIEAGQRPVEVAELERVPHLSIEEGILAG